MSRTLAEGLGPDEPSLEAADEERLLTRIRKEAGRADEPARGWGWLRPLFLGPALAAAGLLVWFVSSRNELEPAVAPESTVARAQPPPVPAFLLPYEKPDVRLGMAALTWRGATTSDNQLLTDLKPGLDAYRQSDYATADRELTALAARYPGTVEILFYQGVSRLFLDDLPGAIASLTAAEAVGDSTFAADVSWYRAVAEQRAGNVEDARTRLDALCRANGEGAVRACAALEQLAKAGSIPR
jgi:hypothetical protein